MNRLAAVCGSRAALLRGNQGCAVRAFSSSGKDDGNAPPPQPQGWISKLLVGQQFNAEGALHKSHSSMLSSGEYIYEISTHNYHPGSDDKYLEAFGEYKKVLNKAMPTAELVGSWQVQFGRHRDQAIHLWRYTKGYTDVDSHIELLSSDASLRASERDMAQLCSRRKDIVVKSFSYWGDPKPRPASHVYDLRSYVLKPGSMIEWGNAWARGISYRKDDNQDVGGFFAQVGQLYVVYHLWAYPSMSARNDTRQSTWAKPGWDATVALTVPLIKKMQSKILVPTKYSTLQ